MKVFDHVSLEAELRQAHEEIRRLQSVLTPATQQITRLTETIEDMQAELATFKSSIAKVEGLYVALINGHIWRSLTAVGNFARKIRLPGSFLNSGDNNTYLFCDEPLATDERPRSGCIIVRGWCLAPNGVDAVELRMPGSTPLRVAPFVSRPDIKKLYPDLDKTGRAGFNFEVDSRSLPKGRYALTLRLISHGRVVRNKKTYIQIDHEKGFASDYARWINEIESVDEATIAAKLAELKDGPLMSIIMPVYNTEPSELQAAIKSVTQQSYGNWQLCIADDASSRPEVRAILEDFAHADARIMVTYRPQRGGISHASNSAWDMAAGQFICFLDHDDTLAPHALAFVCWSLRQNPEVDFLYSDEDKIDLNGRRYEPFFKPDWSPDLILAENYICHFLVLRRNLAEKIGRLNPVMDGAQDHDLILRATEQAKHVEHIPKVLYHWRAGVASTASGAENKDYTVKATRQALELTCSRRGNGGTVEPAGIPGRWRIRYPIPNAPRVSIIIASGGQLDALRANLDSIFTKSTYSEYEVVMVDNSKGTAIENLIKEFQKSRPQLRYVDSRKMPFNHSALNNNAARLCNSPMLLFLNDDTSVISPGWIEAMLELALRPEVGGVGAKLLYPDGLIQHAGVAMGIYNNCGHSLRGLSSSTGHYFDFSDVIRNVSAVTGACFMIRAEVFWQVNGWSETEFPVAFNDIDMCLRIGALGYRILYTPHAVLYHYESLSKTSDDLVPHRYETARMRLKWNRIIASDPFYSPNLTRDHEDYASYRVLPSPTSARNSA